MLTPSILLLMTSNVFAASGAALFALQISAFETRNDHTQSTMPASDDIAVTQERVGREAVLARSLKEIAGEGWQRDLAA